MSSIMIGISIWKSRLKRSCLLRPRLDFPQPSSHTDLIMQLSVNKKRASRASRSTTLDKLKTGETAILDRLDLPNDVARRLMELGFLPGHTVIPSQSAPGGEPR